MRELASAALRLLAVRVSVALLGAPRTQRLVERSQGQMSDRGRAERAARAIQRAARRLPLRTSCFEQSLALTWMLHAAGMQAAVRFAVRREHGPDPLSAHAWVEHDGQALLDDAPLHFTPLSERTT